MDCRDVDRLIDPWLDRQLNPAAGDEMEAHLNGCERCRREWGNLLMLLTRPAPVSVPDGLRDRIVGAWESQLAEQAPVADPAWHRRLMRMRPFAAVAACVLFFITGWLVSTWWAPPPAGTYVSPNNTPQRPATVVVSPWILSSMAQAAAMPVPLSPAVMLAGGVLPEMVTAQQAVDEPVIRVYQPPADAPATQPSGTPDPNLQQIMPIVPRYWGA